MKKSQRFSGQLFAVGISEANLSSRLFFVVQLMSVAGHVSHPTIFPVKERFEKSSGTLSLYAYLELRVLSIRSMSK